MRGDEVATGRSRVRSEAMVVEWAPSNTPWQFTLLAPIAVGATTRVDLARLTSGELVGSLVAVKRLLPEAQLDSSTQTRFLDELATTAAIRHPNVVRVLAIGRDADGPFLAVELVQGVSLARLMKSVFETGEQFPDRLVVAIGARIASGLASAHDLRDEQGARRDLVHRDLAASNVLVSFGGEVKVADFGLAKAKDRLSQTTGELPSRPVAHIAPEELMQQAVDHRADLFALGVLLFELLTGRSPFEGTTEVEVMRAVLHQPAPALAELDSRHDGQLSALIARLLEKTPSTRPSSAHEVALELDQWLELRGFHRDAQAALARFVRRNSVRQMRWFERVTATHAPAEIPTPRPAPLPPQLAPAARPAVIARSATVTGPSDAETTLVDRQAKPQRRAPNLERPSGLAQDDEARVPQAGAVPRPNARAAPRRGPRDTRPDAEEFDDVEVPTLANRLTRAERDALARARASSPAGQTDGAFTPGYPEPSTLSGVSVEELSASVAGGADEARTHPRLDADSVAREASDYADQLLAIARNGASQAARARETERIARLEAERSEAETRTAELAAGVAREALALARAGRTHEALVRLGDARAAIASDSMRAPTRPLPAGRR